MTNQHQLWLFFWFFVGMLAYQLKRAYYLVTGPNPVANTYAQFMQRCWMPLLVRGFIDTMIYWVLFFPGIGTHLLSYLGWSGYADAIDLVTQVSPIAGLFGLSIDVISDFALSKVPIVKDIFPQMPAPLESKVPTDKQLDDAKADSK